MPDEPHSESHGAVEMPRPTAAPMILAVGLLLLGAGAAMSYAMAAVGGVILVAGLSVWIGQLLPGRGHFHEHLAPPDQRAQPIVPAPGAVEQLVEGVPGYRMRLPLQVHPISAGVKGGFIGSLLMPIPALLWGYFSGHGLWYPVNLLAGMVTGGVEKMSVTELEQFHLTLLVIGGVIHLVMACVMGLIYGVLMPTLPYIHRSVAWGGLLMPLFWTAVSFEYDALVNRTLEAGVSWPWFIFSQFVFGVTAGPVAMRADRKFHPIVAGILAGAAGGLMMTIPALLWGIASHHGIWYPSNLLVGMVRPEVAKLPPEALDQFHSDWFATAVLMHAMMCAGFGIIYAYLLPKLRPIPAPLSWGAVLLPLLWTGASYSLMGVVNPKLNELVDWPWFIVSQFVFGITAAVVVVRTETMAVPPAGMGPDTASLTS